MSREEFSDVYELFAKGRLEGAGAASKAFRAQDYRSVVRIEMPPETPAAPIGGDANRYDQAKIRPATPGSAGMPYFYGQDPV